nr:PREDICTED: disintegrin and metalloproteinase domain-containing protein 8 isoform X2 [Equus przewalskii]
MGKLRPEEPSVVLGRASACPGSPPAQPSPARPQGPLRGFRSWGAQLPSDPRFEVGMVWGRPPHPGSSLSLAQGLYPESVSYVLGAQEHTFTLHLRKNRDLVGSGYTETYTAASGSQVTEQLQRQDHCFYQGHVEGHQHSAASLSTCAGLRGFFRAGSTVHLIEPLDGSSEEGQHALYQAQHLQQKAGTCGVSNASLENILGPRVLAAFRPRDWLPYRDTRYVELFVVVDKTEFQQVGSREAVRTRVLEVVNHVDKLYQALNFRVVLVGLEIWNDGDKIKVSPQADTTLDNFLVWRAQDLVRRQVHDNAQLITGVDFTGSTVGLARVSTMCSQDSGAVNQDNSKNPISVASIMAHEMGHNLGMDHDENVMGCYCPMPQDSGGCVMAARIGVKFPRMFSHCSRANLEMFMEKPLTNCVVNAPDPDRLVGGPVCGNGFVERGEQCDCGPPEDCRNQCCNATTCRLAEGAECAHGGCCHGCRVKLAGEVCRPQKDGCDLEEYCDGQQPVCPEDAFQENGTPCPEGYCYDGNCPTPAQRCRDLWGPGSWAAAELCYAHSISPGCKSTVPLGSSRVNKCGALYCQGGQKPPERTSCTFVYHSSTCQALGLDGGMGYEQVPEGTQCGEGKVCWKGHCQDFHVYRSRDCSARCSDHGVCNHKQECQCHPGWAPPYCAERLANTASWSLLMVLVPVVLLVALGLILACVVIYCKHCRTAQWRNVASKTNMGLSNPTFHEGSGTPAKGRAPASATGSPEAIPTTAPNQPPSPKAFTVTPKQPPAATPAAASSLPFTVPVYTRKFPDQPRPAPPAKPRAELKPKQGVVGSKVALKPTVQRR